MASRNAVSIADSVVPAVEPAGPNPVRVVVDCGETLRTTKYAE